MYNTHLLKFNTLSDNKYGRHTIIVYVKCQNQCVTSDRHKIKSIVCACAFDTQ